MHALRPLLGTLLLVAPVAAQTPTPHILLQQGDTFAFGLEVAAIRDMGVATNGSWIALCRDANGNDFVVRDGMLGPRVGGQSQGETIASIAAVAIDASGTAAIHYRVEDPPGSGVLKDRIRVGTNVVLSEGDNVSLFTLGLSGTLFEVYGFDFEGTEMVISCYLGLTGGGLARTLLVGSNAPGTFTPVGGFVEGSAIAGASSPFFFGTSDIDLLSSGRFSATVNTTSFAAGTYALIDTGVAVAESGAPGLAPNSTWTFAEQPTLRLNTNGQSAVAGEIELSNGLRRGAIYVDGNIVMIENQLLGIGLGTVADFARTDMVLGGDGDVLYTLPLNSGEQVLMENASALLKTGTATAEGRTITRFNGVESTGSSALAQSEDGSLVLIDVLLEGIGSALLLLERDLSAPTSCAAVPNSTGSIGHLEASGSRVVSINDLTLTAFDLPALQFGLLACSLDEGFFANPGGSTGNVCIGGNIGRFNSLVAAADAGGTIDFAVDLTALPQPMGTVAAMPGDTWYFQVWHREPPVTGQTSNFTEAVSVEML